MKGFCWQGEETLLYTVPVEADDAFPDGQTVLYRQNAGSAAEEVCRGEGSLSLEGVLTDGSIVFSRVDNLTTEAALEGLAGHERLAARLAEKERNEVCTVFDEYPFWFNGKGVINKTRKNAVSLGRKRTQAHHPAALPRDGSVRRGHEDCLRGLHGGTD